MRRRAVLAIVLAGAALIDLAVGWTSCSSPPCVQDVAVLSSRAVPLDLDKPYAAGDYRFLDAAIGSASIVQLGESLHITAEFPRARLRAVQYLHEQRGFDVLALEGSLVQSWLAEEQLLHSTDSRAVDRAQSIAWFMLWRTPAMREVMAYVDATRSTPRPLYLTSFDVEIGQSAEYQGEARIVTDLIAALRSYGPPPDPEREPELRRGLAAIVDCSAPAELASSAVGDLETWIGSIAARVQPPIHAAALRMIPDNFRGKLELCARTRGAPEKWQEVRDELNARTAIALRDRLSASHAIIVWAHHSHVSYNSRIPSMGQHLHDALGGAVYTIGTFAGAGRVIDGTVFGERDLPAISKVGVERMLGAVDHDAYFVDVSRLPTGDLAAGWLVPQTSRYETLARRPTILAKDFDGAIYVARVHPSAFFDSFAVTWILRIWGFVVEHDIGFAIVMLAGFIAAVRAIARRVRRRLQRRSLVIS
ncbi:MAG TPA: erythromycin esterase family protein [Kofleriaceae bacterium]